jgi:hypothetical protein
MYCSGSVRGSGGSVRGGGGSVLECGGSFRDRVALLGTGWLS